jgi:formamidopyrimidine-DNA glycosylase
MPELPEVESIRLQLQTYIVGHRIDGVEIRYKKCFTGDPKNLKGGKIEKIRRFGKALVVDLDNGYSLVIHIKMTGQFVYRGSKLKNPPDISDKVKGGLNGKHTHVVFSLDRGGKLYYNDYRKFGWIKVVGTSEVEDVDFIKKLGPEFLDSLTLDKFKGIVKSTSRSIKTLLMDQSKVAGVGNIYANDALFLAEIHPEKKANTIIDGKIGKLYKAVEEVLQRSIKYGGSSEVAYVRPDGTDGQYQEHSLVYGKDGESCPNGCGGIIKKIKTSGRGTYFCPKCQKK